jgi:hypothetical protein
LTRRAAGVLRRIQAAIRLGQRPTWQRKPERNRLFTID